MDHEKSRIAVLILNWNSYNYIRTCLKSLEQCDKSLFTPIIIDNNSSDDSLIRLEKEYPSCVFIKNQDNLGFTGGNNVGITYALAKDFPFIMLLNNDTEVKPGFFEILLKRMDEDPSIGAIQPKMLYNHDRSIIWNAGGKLQKWFARPITIGDGKKDQVAYDQPGEVDWISACCIMARREIIQRVGGQNEIFFYGSFDDVDWSIRLSEKGANKLFYEPQAVLYHDAGVAGKNPKSGSEGILKPFVHYLTQRNNIFFLRLHSRVQYLPTIIVFHLVRCLATLGYFLVRGRYKKFKAASTGIWDGLRLDITQDINHVAAIKKLNK